MMFLGDALMLKQLGPERFKEWRKEQAAEYQRELDELKRFDFGKWYPADTHPGAYAMCFVFSEDGSILVSYGPKAGGGYWYNEYGNGGLSHYWSEPDPDYPSGPYKQRSRALKITHWQRYPEPPPPPEPT